MNSVISAQESLYNDISFNFDHSNSFYALFSNFYKTYNNFSNDKKTRWL